MNPNEKIQLDDITFDDVIGGAGVTTIPDVETPIEPQPEPEPGMFRKIFGGIITHRRNR